MEDILLEFAKQNGVSEEKVHEFLAKKNKVNTLRDLMKMPSSSLWKYTEISSLPRTLRTFVEEWYDGNRYETWDIWDIVDLMKREACANDIDYSIDKMIDGDYSCKFCEVKTGVCDNCEEEKEDCTCECDCVKFIEIIKCMIEDKFGSVKLDW